MNPRFSLLLMVMAGLAVAFVPLPVPSSTHQERTIRIEASQFSYAPSEIQINPGDTVNIQNELEHLVLARVLLAQNEVDAASDLLERLRGTAEAAGRTDSTINALVLQALALKAGNSEIRALAALERALELAEQEGYVRTFLDEGWPMAALLRQSVAKGISRGYASRLLGEFGSPAEGPPAESSSEH